MPQWVVTYTSMPIDADTAETAIAREGSGGGHWNAYPLRSRPGALEVGARLFADGDCTGAGGATALVAEPCWLLSLRQPCPHRLRADPKFPAESIQRLPLRP